MADLNDKADLARIEPTWRTNAGVLARLTDAAAPGFVARGGGAIVEIRHLQSTGAFTGRE